MKSTKILTIIALLLLGILAGCGSGGDGPTLPGPVGPQGGDYDGDQPEPPIPTPFSELREVAIIDMEWEADGDLVAATSAGALLFTPYGLFKRNLGSGNVYAVANNDTGRGMSYYPNGDVGNTGGWDDDVYVSGAHGTVSFNATWYDEQSPDFTPNCDPNITLGWSAPSPSGLVRLPTGFEYHPFTGRVYILESGNDTYIGDSDCIGILFNDIITEVVQPGVLCGSTLNQLILSYDQMAPFMDGLFNGPGDSDIPDGDFVVYVDKPVWDCLGAIAQAFPDYYGYQMMQNVTKCIMWDGQDPDINPFASGRTPSRQGMSIDSVQDFTFDKAARMILTLPNADSYSITEPVFDGDHIIIHRTVGGRQNGMGTGPSEFQGPSGCAIDPLTQNHIICDAGNNRVQIFDENGDFVRQFLTGASPHKALFDYWGNLLVATNNGLELYNQQGSMPIYGSIEGFVKDKNTQLPLENALVYIISTFALPVQGAYTNKDGYFQLYAVPAGTHNMAINKPAYFDTSAVIEAYAGERTEVNFYLDRVPVTSPGTGNVTGTFFDPTLSLPIPGLAVSVKGSGVSDLTNGSGEFLLIGVNSGPQLLQVSLNGQFVWEKNIIVPDGQTLDIGWVYLQ